MLWLYGVISFRRAKLLSLPALVERGALNTIVRISRFHWIHRGSLPQSGATFIWIYASIVVVLCQGQVDKVVDNIVYVIIHSFFDIRGIISMIGVRVLSTSRCWLFTK